MGARTDAARAEVVARRQLLADEVVNLRAAGRSAVDIPAKLKRQPAKIGAAAAGVAFVALKGPQRLYHGIRRVVLGPKANLPKSMLPKEIDKAVRSLGDDGERVRGVIEREFAGYLAKNRPEREARDLGGTLAYLGGNILRPVTAEAGKRLAKQLFNTDAASYGAALGRIKERRAGVEKAAAEQPAPEKAAVASPNRGRWERRRTR